MNVANSIDIVLLFSTNFNMIVNRIIESPGHGKVVIDGINFDEKRCLIGKICMISTPEADNSK